MATLMETAKGWLSIGGRILIFPDGRVDGALSAEHLLSLKLAPAEAERRMAIAKAYNAAQDADADGLAALVRENGTPTGNGFVVWEERPAPTLTDIARAFVAIGGRVWIGPGNSLGAMMDAESVYSVELTETESDRRRAIGRAFLSAKAADPHAVATLVRERGEPQGPFIVWEA
ncbi:hypothetical protein DMC47_16135 [Nostoc sp. 3335mG]|nr:hypothetical protein DMC47_16135 [Nostoc sp. 3335mG]